MLPPITPRPMNPRFAMNGILQTSCLNLREPVPPEELVSSCLTLAFRCAAHRAARRFSVVPFHRFQNSLVMVLAAFRAAST